jgi:hypothetical protein
MKKLTIYPIGKRTIFAIVLLCLVFPLTAQTDSIENLPQYLYPNFTKSIVKFKTGGSITAILNYNTVSEKMIFYQNSAMLTLKNPETVDTIFMLNAKFVFNKNVFYEVLLNSPVSLFIQHKSNLISPGKPAAYGGLSETASSTSISQLNNDNTYNLKLPENYKVIPSPVFWVRINNVMQRFSSERQFLKIIPSKEDEIKKFIKNSNINIKKQNDLIKLVTYCNELIS